MTRKGAQRIDDPEARTNASGTWRSAMESSDRSTRAAGLRHADGTPVGSSGRSTAPDARAPAAWEPEEWILEEPDLEREAGRAVSRGRAVGPRGGAGRGTDGRSGRAGAGTERPTRAGSGAAPSAKTGSKAGSRSGSQSRSQSGSKTGGTHRGSDGLDDASIEEEVRAELAAAVGSTKVDKFEVRLKDAGRAFEAERFGDAARILKKLADEAPGAPSVRELYGLTLYRQGKWRLAARELEAFRVLTDSTEQHPVLADCYRALRQYGKVDELWHELKAASPGAELVTEGRIVAAGALADRGDARGSLALLEAGFTFPKRPREHHLRRAYALADAYERVGDVGRAREYFERIAAADPGFADARQRIRNLR